MSTPFTDGLRAYADALDAEDIPTLYGFPTSYTHLLPTLSSVLNVAKRFDAVINVSPGEDGTHHTVDVILDGLEVRFAYIEKGGAR